jgi:hypothetical protein
MSKINLNRILNNYDKKIAQEKIDNEKQKELDKIRRQKINDDMHDNLLEWIEQDIREQDEIIRNLQW